MSKILYICDRRACERCNPECRHTNDIKHAESFSKEFDTYIEKYTSFPTIPKELLEQPFD